MAVPGRLGQLCPCLCFPEHRIQASLQAGAPRPWDREEDSGPWTGENGRLLIQKRKPDVKSAVLLPCGIHHDFSTCRECRIAPILHRMKTSQGDKRQSSERTSGSLRQAWYDIPSLFQLDEGIGLSNYQQENMIYVDS
ncbi:hypothetical protein Y1Q_0000501 [Alligator mississippiensis]|uniref:Uncharacterized protein n=1 Tax=Alligator mississippiensis TaxID=8496 RepID=A0A151MBC5_ALLMI|nr:hypothetical protein Y1Q_0000501 [Alligator mississippiensis]